MSIIVSTERDGEAVDVGDIMFRPGRGDVHNVRFRYDDDFVRHGYPIDPELRLDTAPHQLPGLPLAVEDASPDWWGLALLQRAERSRAAEEGRAPRRLTPDVVLLGASDPTRQGALRFRREQDGPFLAEGVNIPRMLEMSTLLSDAEEVAADPNTDNWQAVKRLLDNGTSALGGARPKVAVRDDDGALWLAKFPRTDDRNNVPVWEMVALNIADRAGLVVPERRLINVSGKRALLVRRFDRREDGLRVPYISARTLMGARHPGASGDYGARGIGHRLRQHSPSPHRDLEHLFRQAALNLVVNNTDNHLRNHGFLRDGPGWTLAPVFDLDPNPDTGSEFATHYNGAVQRVTGLRNLLPLAEDIGIAPARARAMLDDVHQAVEGWDDDARAYGATDSEIALFTDVFTGLRTAIAAVIAPPGSVTNAG